MEIAVSRNPEVSIIVPARNEEVCLGDCLQSLVAQVGVAFEIIVVDDNSTDRTRDIARSFASVRVISSGPLPTGWTGKNNALVAGVKEARGSWLLFTDADTVHLPGALGRALAEAKEHQTDLLSYSPEQIVKTFWERAVMPIVFAELERQYPPAKVSDPKSPIAAANGQYILVRRETYDAIGGHQAVSESLLEDVALARAVKTSGRKIRFRYAADGVRTRMYRNFGQLREGWTKNLALLFPSPGRLAVESLLMWGVALTFAPIYLVMHLQRAEFPGKVSIMGTLFGVPMFSYLLLRSRRAHLRRNVQWKGRYYEGQTSQSHDDAITHASANANNNMIVSRP